MSIMSFGIGLGFASNVMQLLRHLFQKTSSNELSVGLKLDLKDLVCVSAQIDLTSNDRKQAHLHDLQIQISK